MVFRREDCVTSRRAIPTFGCSRPSPDPSWRVRKAAIDAERIRRPASRRCRTRMSYLWRAASSAEEARKSRSRRWKSPVRGDPMEHFRSEGNNSKLVQ